MADSNNIKHSESSLNEYKLGVLRPLHLFSFCDRLTRQQQEREAKRRHVLEEKRRRQEIEEALKEEEQERLRLHKMKIAKEVGQTNYKLDFNTGLLMKLRTILYCTRTLGPSLSQLDLYR